MCETTEKNSRERKIVRLAVHAGEIMMRSGAEIYRIEDTIARICKACDIPDVEVFATPTGIFVSLDPGQGEGDIVTLVKRIDGSATDLGRISKVNKFSREFSATNMSIEEGEEMLQRIEQSKPVPSFVRITGASMTAGFFGILFGADIFQFACAYIIGGGLYELSLLLGRLPGANLFIRSFLCSGLAALCAEYCYSQHWVSSADPIIIGILMIFVPGVAITNAIRDFLTGDFLSGTVRTVEALMIAGALAAGTALTVKLWLLWGGALL